MRQAVILINLGGPATLDDVEPFLANLFADVISFPWGKFGARTLGKFVARRRKKFSQSLYREIGGGSPILSETRAQAKALQLALGDDYAVHVAMRFSPPMIATLQAELLQPTDEWHQVIVLPLFPQYSVATTLSCHLEWQRNGAFDDRAILIGGYHDHKDYIAAVQGTIDQALREKPGGADCHILFSAHGLPESYIRKGDVYQAQIESTVRAVMEGFSNDHSLAYQSKVGPVKWIGPETGEAIAALGRAGKRRLAVVPIAFVSEHVETLHELDILMAGIAAGAGITDFRRVAAVGTHPRFIAALADICRNPERYAA